MSHWTEMKQNIIFFPCESHFPFHIIQVLLIVLNMKAERLTIRQWQSPAFSKKTDNLTRGIE